MTKTEALKLFEERKVRTLWDDDHEKWYFSVVDVVEILTDSPNPRKYWSVLKTRLKEENGQLTTICSQLKLTAADGKQYLTDVADTEQLFRIIQSVPSPTAEPFKQWMAQVVATRLDQLQDPELSIEQAMADYKRLGYSDSWINQRLKSIEIRKDLTNVFDKPNGQCRTRSSNAVARKRAAKRNEWKRHGLQEGVQFATLTDIIYQTWAGKTSKEYKQFKGLKKENLRDNMTNKELVISMLAELSTKEISEVSNPQTLSQHADIARRGGNVAKEARLKLEAETGKKVVSPLKARDMLSLDAGSVTDSDEADGI